VDVTDLVAAVNHLWRRLRHDRMVHFLVLGALIFAFAHGSTAPPTKISISRTYVDALRAVQAKKLGVAALSDERAAEVEHRAIEDEVLYREALRLGLDRDDAVLRQHLVQKMLLLAEDLSGASREATHDELLAYFAKTRDRWKLAERVRLFHVFATKRDTLVVIGDAVRAAPVDVPPPLGDAFPHARDLRANREDLAATYGDELAEAAMHQPIGTWGAPVASRFGWHLIKVISHDEGRPAAFEEVADRVRLDYAVERRHEAIARFLAKVYARYEVDIDGTPVRAYAPTARLAIRSAPSAED
jgi:hypothetical protein